MFRFTPDDAVKRQAGRHKDLADIERITKLRCMARANPMTSITNTTGDLVRGRRRGSCAIGCAPARTAVGVAGRDAGVRPYGGSTTERTLNKKKVVARPDLKFAGEFMAHASIPKTAKAPAIGDRIRYLRPLFSRLGSSSIASRFRLKC